MVGRGHFAYLDLATLGDGGSMGMTSARAVARLADEATRLLSGYRHSDALRTTATAETACGNHRGARSLLTMEDGRTDWEAVHVLPGHHRPNIYRRPGIPREETHGIHSATTSATSYASAWRARNLEDPVSPPRRRTTGSGRPATSSRP